MFFRKGKIRRQADGRLLETLEHLKRDWMQKKALVEKSFEPSAFVLFELHLAQAKYFFLLKEAKIRKVSIRSRK